MPQRALFLLFLALTGCASVAPGPAPTPSPSAAQAPPAAATAPARDPDLLFHALAAAGAPYKHGGRSHASGFDCSGLVAHVYREAYGIVLPHNARAQSKVALPISASDLEVGDLVFYNTQQEPFSHVGIYMGDGRFLHAPKPGTAVRMENMRAAYWTRRFDGARRIPPAPPKR